MVTSTITNHAAARLAHRGLKRELLEFILDFGHRETGSGGTWHAVYERELPSYLRRSPLADAARSWIVLTSVSDDAVITAYPRKDASRHIRQKCRKRRLWQKRYRSLGSYTQCAITAMQPHTEKVVETSC
jgi:hypothetical protein